MNRLLSRLTCGLLLLLLGPTLAMAQTGTVEGTVLDAESGDPLPGATVQIPGTGVGTATDIDGQYEITGVTAETKMLRVSFVGYRTVEREVDVPAGGRVTADFELNPSMAALDEVVVTGVTSETPKAKLSFTVDQVSAEQLERAPTSSPVEALQGKVAGATITAGSGEPGSGFSVRLRATSSLTGSTSPLYIVDGVILGADQVDIGSLDVKNIEVVKGAAASSLYGSRAQNGVINITTKRGGDAPLGQTRVTVRNEFGISSIEEDLKTSGSHALATNAQGQLVNSAGEPVNYGEGAAVDGSGPNGTIFSDNRYADLAQVDGSPYALFDPFDQFFEPGNSWTNYVAIGQNSTKTNFRFSFQNNVEGGVVQGPVSSDGYDRQSFRLNLDHRPQDNLQFTASGYYSQSQSDRLDASEVNDPFFGLQFLTPLSNLLERDENGELLVQPDPRAVEENPLYLIENLDIERNRSRFLGNFAGEYSPFDWATVSASLSYDRSDRNGSEFADKGFKSLDPTPENDGEIEKTTAVQEALNYDVTLSLNDTFGDITARSQLKYQVENNDFLSTFAQGNDLAAAGIPDFANIQDDASKSLNSFVSTVRAEGFYGTLAGDYADKYIVDLLIRRDGSSLFGAEERWQTYFRAAGAWRLSQENWWPLQEQVNEFKLRYSYGTAGARPNFQAQYETFSLSNGELSKATLGNSQLKPELSQEQEFGVEMGILDRVYLDVTYVKNDVEDLLLQVPLIGPLGFGSQWRNAGSTESNTIEANLSTTLYRSRDIGWNFGMTFDRTNQEITEFDANAFRTGPDGNTEFFFYRAGEDIGAMYGNTWISETSELQQMGLDPSVWDKNDDGLYVPVGQGNSWQDGFNSSASGCTSEGCWGTTVSTALGDKAWGHPVKFAEEDGNQFVQIANSIPDFNMNFNTDFRWKGFSAYALVSWQQGGDVYNFTKQWSFRDGRNAQQDQFGKSDETKKPTTYYETLYDATNSNDFFTEDGTFVKLREVSLGYSLDRAQLNNLFGNANFLNRLSFNLTGRNLITFTDYSGFDPEVGDSGDNGDSTLFRVDNFNYPTFRTFTGRLEFQF